MNVGNTHFADTKLSFLAGLKERKKDIMVSAIALVIFSTAAALTFPPLTALALTGVATAVVITFIAIRMIFGRTKNEVIWSAPSLNPSTTVSKPYEDDSDSDNSIVLDDRDSDSETFDSDFDTAPRPSQLNSSSASNYTAFHAFSGDTSVTSTTSTVYFTVDGYLPPTGLHDE